MKLPTLSSSAVLEPAPATGASIPKDRAQTARKPSPVALLLSVVVLNYNDTMWLDRLFASLAAQTAAADLEILFADNGSTDHSDLLAADLMKDRPNWRLLRFAEDLGCPGGYNAAARQARGQYIVFLNPDLWLEPDCLERLMQEVRAADATIATPLVMEYQDDTVQSVGEEGFDVFGFVCGSSNSLKPQTVWVANGPAIVVNADWFRKLGGFDARFFMYAEEYDLCWRTWLAGGKVILAPSARVHHRRSAVTVTSSGGQAMVENRTSDTRRFYANRNGLLVLLKNSQHLLLFLVPLQLCMLAAEALVMGLLSRRISHIRRAYLEAVLDCWRLRRHILAERRRLKYLRRRGDFWMLRFLRGRFNRWREFRRFLRFGLPKVDSK
jgi:GT2 family glycosyltransferase